MEKEFRETPLPTMSNEEMAKDYPRLKLEYTRLHEEFRRCESNYNKLKEDNERLKILNVKFLEDVKKLRLDAKNQDELDRWNLRMVQLEQTLQNNNNETTKE